MEIVKRILLVSHCILNNASKVELDEAGLAEEYKLRSELVNLIIEKNIQVIQLPCPEFIMYGSQRWGHVKNQFQHPFYKEQCRKLLDTILLQVQEYMQYPETFSVLGVVSVEGRLRYCFSAYTTLPYPALTCSLSFGLYLSPVKFSAQRRSTSELLRTL